MVDDVTPVLGNSDNLTLISPEGLERLSPEQRIEVNKYINEKIVASDELLGAITRKIQSLTRRGAK